jgi:hypothetical protein
MYAMLIRSSWTRGGVVAGLMVLAGASIVACFVPWIMDEFVMYHALACTQKSQQLNLYREACGAYPIHLGPLHYQRSFAYIGGLSSVLYAPFHALWNSIAMNYVVGALALFGIAHGLCRSFALPARYATLAMLFFPLLYVTIHDAGPVRISLLAVAWTPVFLARVIRGPRPSAVLALIILWLAATEDKPFFVFLMPGIVVLSLAALHVQGLWDAALRQWRTLLAVFAASSGTCLVFLLTASVGDHSYLRDLHTSMPSEAQTSLYYSGLVSVLFTVDWSFYAHRIANVALVAGEYGQGGAMWAKSASLLLTVTLIALTLSVYGWAGWRHWRTGRADRASGLLLIASVAAFIVPVVVARGWATHHYVYAQLPLWVLVATAIRRRHSELMKWLAGALLTTIAAVTAIGLVPMTPLVSWDLPSVVTAAIRVAGPRTVLNCASWGCYYTYSLQNLGNVPVVFADAPDTMERLRAQAVQHRWDIIQLCRDCSAAQVARQYGVPEVQMLPTDAVDWHAFHIRLANGL